MLFLKEKHFLYSASVESRRLCVSLQEQELTEQAKRCRPRQLERLLSHYLKMRESF